MIDVYWLEQIEADVPAENNWLGPNESRRLSDLRITKRHADWRLGRWTAKRAVSTCLDRPLSPQSLANIEIRSAISGAPEVFLDGEPAPLSLSLSHRSGRAVCALSASSVAIGCDLEEIEPRSDAFIADYFSAPEQALIHQSNIAERAWRVALLWSAKESALKAMHAGLTLDTRAVVVSPAVFSSSLGEWRPLVVRHTNGEGFQGWWQLAGNFVWTMVSAPPPKAPVSLPITYSLSLKEAARCA